MKTRHSLLLLVSGLFLARCSNPSSEIDNDHSALPKNKLVPFLNYTLIGSYPHDTTSFTEGLTFHNGELYESTGATSDLPQTRSLFGTVDLSTGKIKKKAELEREKYFGEGVVFLNGKVYQLTYRTKIGFIYDAITFKKIGTFSFPSKEGWGLTTDGKSIIMSDGTNVITYLEPNTFRVIKSIAVTENNYAKDFLNELEYINGCLYANVWTTNTIIKIAIANGEVIAKLDLTALAQNSLSTYARSLEMNGIAFDSTTDCIYVTGKLWPKIYRIKIQH